MERWSTHIFVNYQQYVLSVHHKIKHSFVFPSIRFSVLISSVSTAMSLFRCYNCADKSGSEGSITGQTLAKPESEAILKHTRSKRG